MSTIFDITFCKQICLNEWSEACGFFKFVEYKVKKLIKEASILYLFPFSPSFHFINLKYLLGLYLLTSIRNYNIHIKIQYLFIYTIILVSENSGDEISLDVLCYILQDCIIWHTRFQEQYEIKRHEKLYPYMYFAHLGGGSRYKLKRSLQNGTVISQYQSCFNSTTLNFII